MSFQKQGGSMRYLWLGPEQPAARPRYVVGGRSVHAPDAASGVSKGTARDTRVHSRGANEAYKAQPFTIKRRVGL